MKKFFIPLITLLVCLNYAFGESTKVREWTAASGHKTKASALKVVDGKVHLKMPNGKINAIDMSLLTAEDQTFLNNHFKLGKGKKQGKSGGEKVKGSGAEKAQDLPLPMGEISGPIKAGGSHYHVYLPKSLKAGRKASLLFYTHSGGGKNPKLIKALEDAAETLGWVMAISVESSNKGNQNNKHVSNCLDHIIETLPVDDGRIHFTGNSGGAAQAFNNTTVRRAFGVMPNVGYIPLEVEPKTKVVYALGGGSDYNRYTTAYAANQYSSDDIDGNGFHRMSPKGHGPSPADLYMDGMIWMHCKYLKTKNPTKEEQADFEASIINWMGGLKKTNSKRAYSTACVVRDVYKISGGNEVLNDAIIRELSADNTNVLYHEGLIDINKLSKDTLSKVGRGSQKNHFCKPAATVANKLKGKYGAVKEIDEILNAIIKKTTQS